jgi:type IV pilus assembly protein PilN
MIRINLLPREEIPSRRGFQLPQLGSFAPVMLVLICLAGLAVLSTYQGRKIASLQTVIAQEEEESRRLAPEIAKIKRFNAQRQQLTDRLNVIKALDQDRYFRIHLLDELNRSMPEHMWLSRFEDVGGDTYAVEGVTFSNFLVSDFLQNMIQSPYFSNVSLLVTEKGSINEVTVVKFKAKATAVRQPAGVLLGS